MRNLSRIFIIAVAFFSLLGSSVLVQAEEVKVNYPLVPSPAPKVLDQKEVGQCACGPCAIFNAFQFGGASLNTLASTLPGDTSADKVRSLIQMYGSKPSVNVHGQPRYLPDGGMSDADLVPFINDWLADKDASLIKGERLTIQNNETPKGNLQRVYNELSYSLAAGFPPVVNLQSYSERKNFFHHYWKWMDGHFVTVVAVQKELPKDASKFCMSVADSQSGRVLQVFVSAGENNSSTSLAKNEMRRSGKMVIPPAQGASFLTIRSPKLEAILTGHDAKSQRTICVLQYIAHR